MNNMKMTLAVAVAFALGIMIGRFGFARFPVSVTTSPTPAVTVSVPIPPPPPSVVGVWESENQIWSGNLSFRPNGTGEYGDWPITWQQIGNSSRINILIY